MGFFDQLANALKRAITLPKAHNSLSDILGPDAALVVTDTVHGLLVNAVTSALHSAVTVGEKDLGKAQTLVNGAVTSALKSVSPALATEIEGAVAANIHNAELLAEQHVADLAIAIVGDVSRLLKIGA